MLPVNYGSFLTVQELKTAKLNYYKPLIQTAVNGIFIFSLTGFFLSATAFGLTFVMKPIQNYDFTSYQTANKLSDKVTKSLTTMRAARPNDINVCVIVDRFLAARPKDVNITSMAIRPERYTIKGRAPNVDRASNFSQNVLFGNRKTVSLNDVQTKDNGVYWTIDVTTKEAGQ